VALLLRASTAPRWWLMAPPTADGTADRLRELAARWPGQHLLVDAPAPPTDTPWPPNLHWLGRVHASLHAALAAAVERVIPWGGMPGWADAERATNHDVAASHPQRADIVDAAVQAVRQLHLGLPAALGADR
jgi:hypothetical protein